MQSGVIPCKWFSAFSAFGFEAPSGSSGASRNASHTLKVACGQSGVIVTAYHAVPWFCCLSPNCSVSVESPPL